MSTDIINSILSNIYCDSQCNQIAILVRKKGYSNNFWGCNVKRKQDLLFMKQIQERFLLLLLCKALLYKREALLNKREALLYKCEALLYKHGTLPYKCKAPLYKCEALLYFTNARLYFTNTRLCFTNARLHFTNTWAQLQISNILTAQKQK